MIDKETFADEFSDLAYAAGIEDTCALEFPEYMYQRNEESPRSYAEVDPYALYFAFAPQVLELPWEHRRGLIMHEIGHVLCRDLPNGGTESDADKAAERAFGERIIYDKAWPGKGLQCVRCSPRENPPAKFRMTENRRKWLEWALDPMSEYGEESGEYSADDVPDADISEIERSPLAVREDLRSRFLNQAPDMVDDFVDDPKELRSEYRTLSDLVAWLDSIQPRENPALPDDDIAKRFMDAVAAPASRARFPIKPDRVASALEDILSGYEQGEIRNAVYVEAKDTLSYAVDKAWDTLGHYTAGLGGDNPESSLSWEIRAGNLHETLSAKKKLGKLKAKPDKPIRRDDSYTFNEVNPQMVADMTRIIDAAYPVAMLVKEMKSMIVKGRAASAGPTKAQISAMERAKDPRLKTCAVCFNEIITGSDGSPMRHGFSVVTQGRGSGLLGAWHTGPCMGTNYPHFGISSAGTKAALSMAESRLAVVRGELENLESRPPLQWLHSASSFDRRTKGAKDEWITIYDGSRADYSTGAPGYDRLLESRVGTLSLERDMLGHSIAFYEDKIANWRPRP